MNELFFDSALIVPSHGKARRWVGIGVNIRGVIVVVFARLGREGISIISMRPASKDERKRYYENR
ncbi:hypothetical protein [Bradyrhizobium sp.]|uniref:hypothetical protein n=1 Tax=Bradyrhizobium sp. TaxID=376 RepID=UPI003C6FBD32